MKGGEKTMYVVTSALIVKALFFMLSMVCTMAVLVFGSNILMKLYSGHVHNKALKCLQSDAVQSN